MLAAIAAVLTLAVQPAEGSVDTHRHDWRACSQTNVIACIDQAARRYHQPVAEAERVAWCESHNEWWASNGADFGLWQFAPSTFAATPYGRHSYWSAKWSSLAAMWMWSRGEQNQWECF